MEALKIQKENEKGASVSLIQKENEKGSKCTLEHLEVIKLAGYNGRTSDVELSMYFIDKAVALERLLQILAINYISVFLLKWIRLSRLL